MSVELLENTQPPCPMEFQNKGTGCCKRIEVTTNSSSMRRSKRVVDLVSLEDSCDKDDSESDESSTRVRNSSGDLGAFGNFCKLRRILDAELEYFHRDVDIKVSSPTRAC